MNMTSLSYALSLLSRSVAFKNLSSASLNVGLSQPQLSRLVAKLEGELGMELLDRRVKRKSSWTPQAIQLADLFTQSQRRLEDSIRALQTDQRARQVHLGTLEGLSETAIELAHRLFSGEVLKMIAIDVFDRSELEAKFLSGDLDLILNTRFPGPAKPRFSRVLGYQSLDPIQKGADYALFSSYEFNVRSRQKSPAKEIKTVVSNSLYVRKLWYEHFGGSGMMPSEVVAKSKKGYAEIFLIGGDWLDPHLWKLLENS
jgi:LysR family transcriptional regulator, transcriptional activator for aaeXAB operon